MGAALLVLVAGVITFFGGIVTANIALVQMASRLNSKNGGFKFRWWNSIGHGSSLVLSAYRQQHSREDELERRLRIGYWITGIGFALMLGSNLLRLGNRGSF